MLEKFFKLKENGTTPRTEIIAGITTFLTMAYILAVNPNILSAAGMDANALFTTTAIAAIVGTLVMALWAKLPFALAPGMGLNAFFAFSVVLGMGHTWQFALTAVLIEGVIFILLTAFNVREAIANAIPKSVKTAISAGIGLFIAFIGWRLLPKKRIQKTSFKPIYTIEIRIPPKSKWIDKTFNCFEENIKELAEIMGLIRRKRKLGLQTNTEIKSGDRFIIQSTLENLEELSNSVDIVISNFIRKGSKNKSEDILLEAIVPTKSNLIGKKVKETNLRSVYKTSFIAISKATNSKIGRIRNIIIEAGDMVLLHCKDPNVLDTLPSYGLIPIETSTLQLKMEFKNFIPLIIFVIAILLSGLSIMPVQIVFSAAALLMLLTDSKALAYVYKQFDWAVIIFLAAIIPLGDALTHTGGADLLAQLIFRLSQHLSIFWTIALLI